MATDGFVLLQLPPASPFEVYVAVAPIQSGEVPLTVPALVGLFTVKVLNELTGLPQPELTV